MLIVDSHLDLGLNALQGNRDLLVSAYTVRVLERSMKGPGRAQGTVGFPEMRCGRVALCFTTVLARSSGRPEPGIDYPTAIQAHAHGKGHLAYYHALEHEGHLRIVRDLAQLDAHIAEWSDWDAGHPGDDAGASRRLVPEGGGTGPAPPLGAVITMESADPVLDTIADLQKIAGLLRDRGYKEPDVAAIMHGNWIGFLRRAWAGGTEPR